MNYSWFNWQKQSWDKTAKRQDGYEGEYKVFFEMFRMRLAGHLLLRKKVKEPLFSTNNFSHWKKSPKMYLKQEFKSLGHQYCFHFQRKMYNASEKAIIVCLWKWQEVYVKNLVIIGHFSNIFTHSLLSVTGMGRGEGQYML